MAPRFTGAGRIRKSVASENLKAKLNLNTDYFGPALGQIQQLFCKTYLMAKCIVPFCQ